MNWYAVFWQDPKIVDGAFQAVFFLDKNEAQKVAQDWRITHPGQVCFVCLIQTAMYPR